MATRGRRPGAHFESDFLSDPRVQEMTAIEWTWYSKLWILSVKERRDVLCRQKYSDRAIAKLVNLSRNSVTRAAQKVASRSGLVDLTDHCIIIYGVRALHSKMAWKPPLACCAQSGSDLSRILLHDGYRPEPEPRPEPVPEPKKKEEKKKEAGAAELPNSRRPTPEEFLEAWNGNAEKNGFRTARSLGKSRIKALNARRSDRHWREGWREALEKMHESAFLRGEAPGSRSGWKADVDFFLRAESVNKILEGKYDDGKSSRVKPGFKGATKEEHSDKLPWE